MAYDFEGTAHVPQRPAFVDNHESFSQQEKFSHFLIFSCSAINPGAVLANLTTGIHHSPVQ